MVAAVALSPSPTEPPPSRDSVVARYRRLRAVSKQINHAIQDRLPRDAFMRHARRLGLLHGKNLVLNDLDDLCLVSDLAIHTASPDRGRAVERYARSSGFPPDSDEAIVVEAMCKARFAIIVVRRDHEAAGLIVEDIVRETEIWLMDEGMEKSAPRGALFATRYYQPDRFAMTAGVLLPLEPVTFSDALDAMPAVLRKSPLEAIEDRRFAETLYRTALADGTMDRVRLEDVPEPVRKD
jgi:hypothetical protein